jgi:hypothetical protein
MKYERGGTVGSVDDSDEAMKQRAMKSLDDSESTDSRFYKGAPVTVTDRNGRIDPAAIGRMNAMNFLEGVQQKHNYTDSAKARAAKNKKDDD